MNPGPPGEIQEFGTSVEKLCVTYSFLPTGVLGPAFYKLLHLFMEQKLQGCLNLCEILESYAAQAEGAAPYPREVSIVFCSLLWRQELDKRPELSTYQNLGLARS